MCTHSGEPWAPEEAAAADGVGSNEMRERGVKKQTGEEASKERSDGRK